jgi:predicted nuclease of predicted toxin-antitoxin system
VTILLDECVPARLKRSLAEHEVTIVPRKGWSGIKNGDLLAVAEKEFDVFITVDRKLAEQQHLPGFDIAVILLRAPSNRLEDIRPVAAAELAQLADAPVGAVTVIGGA